MPIKIPEGLPARSILDAERIFALERPEAEQQDVRPLRLLILNLMPKKNRDRNSAFETHL